MPDGYDTRIGHGGSALSAGQRQRIALARALYDNPVLVVLDEPNSNLDEAGDRALAAAIQGLRARNCTTLLITHKPNILGLVDKIMLLKDGSIATFGPRDEVLEQIKQAQQQLAQQKLNAQASQGAGQANVVVGSSSNQPNVTPIAKD